ncbi:MAG: aldehyde dehydrogenase family protein [Planctomycetota bacterium]|nr:aldehyde dehydrogenase family protein [Planctomycetota bacterium]
MPDDARLDVQKTLKLFIDGKFPRSESGRTWGVHDTRGGILAHASLASRKDLRDAVEAARRAQPGWAAASPLLRGQILYRVAEMMESRRRELEDAIHATRSPGRTATKRAARANAPDLGPAGEVSRAIDRVVHYAGWADKFSQVLGCHNPVAGSYYTFTVAEPTGVVAAFAPDRHPLLALVSLLAPALCAGNTCVAVPSMRNPLAAVALAEAIATGDVPPGVVNILTGDAKELAPIAAQHRDIDAIVAGDPEPDLARTLRAGVAENLKRVRIIEGVDWHDDGACCSPWWIEPLVEFKTVWQPASA